MFAALHIPDFPVAAALRGNDEKHLPHAIVTGESSHGKVEKLPLKSINQAARDAGVQQGWPLNRSLVRCPGLRVIARNAEEEEMLSLALIERAESLTPDVEATAPDLVLLDLSHRNKPYLAELAYIALEGVEVRFAVAHTPDLAAMAARCDGLAGGEVNSQDLAGFSIELLEILDARAEIISLLSLWGIKTLGAFIALPRQQLAGRLGAGVGEWHDVLLGKTCRLLRLHRPPESLLQRYNFEDEAGSSEPIIFALKGLLHTLEGRLSFRHLAVCLLKLTLHLESGNPFYREIRLPEPQSSAARILPLLQTLLENLRLDSLVQEVELDVETTFATAIQRDWQGGQLAQPQRWNETLAKLQALLGEDRVGIPVAGNSHNPDAFTLHHPLSGVVIPHDGAAPVPSIPLQRFRPPQKVAVMHETRNGQPWPLAVVSGHHTGRIMDRRGPYPVSGDWWHEERMWQRLEWDIQLETRQLLRLVYQPPDHWQLEGCYR